MSLAGSGPSAGGSTRSILSTRPIARRYTLTGVAGTISSRLNGRTAVQRRSALISLTSSVIGEEGWLPNKRLKLPGGDRFKGIGVLCPGGHGLTSTARAPTGGSPAA